MDYKFVRQFRKKNSKKSNKIKYLNRFLFLVLIVLAFLIVFKIDKNNDQVLYKFFKDNNINFASINNFFKTKFGSVLSYNSNIDNNDTELVFGESFSYKNVSLYENGAIFEVDDNYLVSSLEGGVVVYIGEKDGFSNVVIIQQVDGVDTWYGNLENVSVSLYDYVQGGETIANVKGNELYLVFDKDGEYLNYKEYLK